MSMLGHRTLECSTVVAMRSYMYPDGYMLGDVLSLVCAQCCNLLGGALFKETLQMDGRLGSGVSRTNR